MAPFASQLAGRPVGLAPCVQSAHAKHAVRANRRQEPPCARSHEDSDRCTGGCDCLRPRRVGVLGLLPLGMSLAATHPAAVAAQEAGAKYTPSPYTPGWEVYFGALAAAIPFVIGSWEFGKRILIQRRCARCEGSGLVLAGQTQQRWRKCPECGGFFPWQGWTRFFTSTAAPGNGGPLRAPRGQTSIFYKVPEARPKAEAPASNRSSKDGSDTGGEGGGSSG